MARCYVPPVHATLPLFTTGHIDMCFTGVLHVATVGEVGRGWGRRKRGGELQICYATHASAKTI